MLEFKVWDPDQADESGADTVFAPDAERAAEEFVEVQHSNWDYADEVTVSVRGPKGELTKWLVQAEEDIHFHASEAS